MAKGMRRIKLIGFIFVVSLSTVAAQEITRKEAKEIAKLTDEELLKSFDEKALIEDLKAREIPETEFSAIIRHKKKDFILAKRGLTEKQITFFSEQKASVGPCDNAGFETGSFTNWIGATGSCAGMPSTPPSWTPGLVSGRHTIVSGTGFDPIAINVTSGLPEIPLIAPGGLTYSTRLGNDQIGAETEYLRYPITVTASNTSFTYQYAVVLEEAGHTADAQPRFDITVFDASGTPVSGPCGVYSVEATSASTDTTFRPYGSIVSPLGYYKKWTTVSIDLTPYIGTTVTIQFQSSDCTQTGHYGYAYIDASCSQLAAQVAFCPNDTMLLLTAPGGFNTYQWFDAASNPISASAGGTNDTLVILNPVLGQVYSVSMLSASGCGTSLTVTLAYSDILVNTSVTPVTCFGDNDGFAYAVPTGAIPPFTYVWVDAATGNVISNNDSLLNAIAGTYYITVSSLGGCSRIDTLTVAQPPNPGDTLGVGTVFCPGDPMITLYGPAGFTTYQWYANGTGTGPIVSTGDTLNLYNPVAGQQYTVVLQNPGGCPVFLTTTLNYSPPPLLPDYIVKSNVFTPDGDTKNEKFDLNQFAFVSAFHFEVYNRWGRKVFESDDLTNQWDGKVNGKDADEGVYFWLASYTSSCTVDAKPVENKGFVHLLRNK
jgi:gliding motility-associated-like protein